MCNAGEQFFRDILKEQNVKSLRRVFALTVDGKGKVFLQLRGEKYRTFQIELPEGCTW